MAQPYINVANTFRIRFKQAGSEDLTDTWMNEWDAVYPANTLPTLSDSIVTDLLSFSRFLAYPDVLFTEVLIDDWHLGPVGGNTFFSLTGPLANLPGTALTTGGLQGQSGGPIGGEVCLLVDRGTNGQRRGGRLFVRGALQKNDVASSAGGEWVILNNTQFPAAFNQLVTSFLAPHFGGGTSSPHLAIVRTHRSPGSRIVIAAHTTPVDNCTLPLLVVTNKINRRSKR
jgi:hypothetical protein